MDETRREFLRKLLETHTPSGHELPGQRTWVEYVSEFADEVRTDEYGNAVAVREGTEDSIAVAGPGVPARGRVSDQVRSVDIFPTLLSAAGIDSPGAVAGQDLLAGSIEHLPAHVRAVGASGERERWLDGVRYEGWKYVQGRDRELCQLFDLESDPKELENVADEHPEVVARLRDIVDEHVARERGLETAAVSEGAEQRMTSRLEDLGYL